MGFFKFFKRKEESLDIPPPPPDEMLKTGAPLTPKESIPPPPKFDIPPVQQEKELKPEPEEKEVFPELPPAPEFSIPETKEPHFEPIKKEAEVTHPISEPKPIEIKEEPEKDIKEEIRKVVDERHFLREPLFVKKDQYQNMLDGINIIKNKTKECDFIVNSLNDIKNKKDKEFSRWRSSLEDMQRKISLVEKSLFEVAK